MGETGFEALYFVVLIMPLSVQHKKNRGKNIVLALCLVAFVVLVYFGSVVRSGGG